MRREILLISRYTNLLPWYKSVFEEVGYIDVYVTDKDKDGLNMLINDIKPRGIFIASNFYSIGTPYMVGLLHEMFPKLNITVASVEDYPEELTPWFIFHGAKSYVNLLDGVDEFKNGLKHILGGERYIAPGTKYIIDSFDEWPDCNLKVTRRQKEVLLMVCNAYSKKKIQNELQISEYTVHYHLKELMKIFHVHSKEELIKVAYCLDLVLKNHLDFSANKEIINSLPEWARVQIEMNKIARRKYQ
jgi:DNA-binding CsgD family transcriptional regulator